MTMNYGPDYRPASRPPAAVSDHDRRAILHQAVNSYTAMGWHILNGNDYAVTLTAPATPTNHVLHLLLTVLTCGLWGVVWLVIAVSNNQSVRTMTLWVNEYGQVGQR
jgi:hypothetical protein